MKCPFALLFLILISFTLSAQSWAQGVFVSETQNFTTAGQRMVFTLTQPGGLPLPGPDEEVTVIMTLQDIDMSPDRIFEFASFGVEGMSSNVVFEDLVNTSYTNDNRISGLYFYTVSASNSQFLLDDGIVSVIVNFSDAVDVFSSTSRVSVSVQYSDELPNINPTAQAGNNRTVVDSNDDGVASVQLNPNGSSDADGSIVSYLWEWDDNGPQSNDRPAPTVDFPLGTTIVTLTVTDDDGGTDTDTVAITVLEPSFSVTFNLDGKGVRIGGGGLTQTIQKNGAAVEPVVNAFAGWIFNGWDTSFSSVTENLTVTAIFETDPDNVQPGQDATFTENRLPANPNGPESTIEAASLTVGPGANFGLGVNETLILTDGPLTIQEGAVFQGNGSIVGEVSNMGLMIIRVVENMILPKLTNNGGFFSIKRGDTTESVTIESPVNNGAVFSSDASLEITETFTQTNTGTLRLFAQGVVPGETYGQLTVGNDVNLDGEIQWVLDQALFDPFILQPGDTFDLVRINPSATGKTISLQGTLSYRILGTVAIEDQFVAAGLSPVPYVGQENDPDNLVEISGSLFSFSLVNGDTVLRATFNGVTPPTGSLTIQPEFTLGSDNDPGSDAWETANGFDPDVDDVLTKDSDNDGQPDILELFAGTKDSPNLEMAGFRNSSFDSESNTLATTYRRDPNQTEVKATAKWSPDLVNWYESGETAPGGITVSFQEVINDMGTYQLVDVTINVDSGPTPRLYYTFDLTPNE